MVGLYLGVELFSNKTNLCTVILKMEAAPNLNLYKPALMRNACQGKLASYMNNKVLKAHTLIYFIEFIDMVLV